MPGTEPPETNDFDLALRGLVLDGNVEARVGVPGRG